MTEKTKLIVEALSGDYSVSELARRFGICRKSVYKWKNRFDENSWEGLKERSRARHQQEGATNEELVKAILELKARWPDWGAPKLRKKLELQVGEKCCPSESTVGMVLKKHGLVKSRRIKRRAVHGGAEPLSHCQGANVVWCADFKGWWRTNDGQRFEPLTVTDGWSRYLLRCVGLPEGTRTPMVKAQFEMLFREYGLPEAIRTDNGSPFASAGLGGLTQLSAWWVRLGIRLERITPGCPQENGRHERMHRTLEESSARVPRKNMVQQQRAMEKFCHEYNYERPHESLGDQTPAEFYRPSERIYCGKLPFAREYPMSWSARKVRASGQMKWDGNDVRITDALIDQYIGLEPLADGVWNVWFEYLKLGTFDERTLRIKRFKTMSEVQGTTPNPR